MSDINEYFGAAEDMYSGSQDPDEQDRALQREAEKRRREQEKEQARLLREQQAQQESQQRELQRSLDAQSTPKAAVIPEEKQAIPKADPDDPFMGIPEARRNEMQLHKFDDNRDIPDYSGFPLTPDARQEYVERRKKRLNDHTQDMKDVLFMMDLRRDPAFKDQVEKESRKLQQWMKVEPGSLFDLPIPKSRNLLNRVNPDNQEKRYRTMEYKPGRDAAKAIPAIALEVQDKSKAIPANNILEQTAHVNDPQDESMMGAYVRLGQALTNAFRDDKAVTGYGRSEVGHSDQSYAEGEKVLGEYVEDGLGVDKDVHGKDRSRPVGHPDMSYGPGLGSPTQNFGPGSAVTGKDNQPVGAPNLSYWSDWGTEQSRKIPLAIVTDGAKQAINDTKILFMSGAVVAGESIFDLIGGDPACIRKAQALLDQYQRESRNMKPLEMKEIYIEGDPEKTMQNITRYLYQELGNQLVKVPAYFVAGQLKTIAQLTGASGSLMAAKLHADIRNETGESRVRESVMYAVPLGLMSAMLWPLRGGLKFKGPKETMDYVTSMVSSAAVHKVQDINKGMVVNRMINRKKEEKED